MPGDRTAVTFHGRLVGFPTYDSFSGGRYIGCMRWLCLLVAILSVSCADDTSITNPSTTTSATGVPATVILAATVGGGPAPVASIVATVRDVDGLVVSGITVSFSTTVGFITSPAQTGTAGTAEAILSNVPAGSTATVTAKATSTTATVTATTVAHF